MSSSFSEWVASCICTSCANREVCFDPITLECAEYVRFEKNTDDMLESYVQGLNVAYEDVCTKMKALEDSINVYTIINNAKSAYLEGLLDK